MSRISKSVPFAAQIGMFLDGSAAAFDGLEDLSASERRAWHRAREIAREKGRGEAVLYLFRHGTIDRNHMIFDHLGKTARAAVAAPLRQSGVSQVWERTAGRFARTNSKRDRKLRWEDFARRAARGEIILSFFGDDRNLTAIVSQPGQPDRRLGGSGVKKLAQEMRKLARPNAQARRNTQKSINVQLFEAPGRPLLDHRDIMVGGTQEDPVLKRQAKPVWMAIKSDARLIWGPVVRGDYSRYQWAYRVDGRTAVRVPLSSAEQRKLQNAFINYRSGVRGASWHPHMSLSPAERNKLFDLAVTSIYGEVPE